MRCHALPCLLALCFCCACCFPSHPLYVSHSFGFPAISYSVGLYHIHCPAHFMEAHGFALPGFRLLDARRPKESPDGYLQGEFDFCTYFSGRDRLTARLFSGTVNRSHVVILDPNGVPSLLGELSVERYGARGHRINAQAQLLRPATPWERMLGGRRMVREAEVQRAIKKGYRDLRTNMNLVHYVGLAFERDRRQHPPHC